MTTDCHEVGQIYHGKLVRLAAIEDFFWKAIEKHQAAVDAHYDIQCAKSKMDEPTYKATEEALSKRACGLGRVITRLGVIIAENREKNNDVFIAKTSDNFFTLGANDTLIKPITKRVVYSRGQHISTHKLEL